MPDTTKRRPTDYSSTAWSLGAGLVAGFVLATLVSCAGPRSLPGDIPLPDNIDPETAIPHGPDAEYTADGLVRVPTPARPNARLYVKPPRPHLQRYDSMILAPTVLTYHDRTNVRNAREQKQMLNAFQSNLLAELNAGEFWAATETKSETTLIVRATVADLDLGSLTRDSGTSSGTFFVSASGGVVLGFEIFDSASGEPLMRFVERRRLPAGTYSGADVNDQRLKQVFREFADNVGSILRLQYRVIREIERREKMAPHR